MSIQKRLVPVLIAAALLAACASKPPAQPEEPQPVEEAVTVIEEPPAPEPVIEADPNAELRVELAALLDQVLEQRILAVNLEANTRLPERYRNADQAYVEGKNALEADQLTEAKENLDKALALFTALVQDSYTAAISQQKTLIAQVKAAAEKAGADSLSPEHMTAAAALTDEAAAFESEGAVAKALDHYRLIRQVYDAAEKRSRALTVRQRIDELNFASADGGNYELAGQKLRQSDGLWQTSPSQALDSMEEALLRYNLVLNKGWELLSGTRRTAAEDFKRRADDIRANIAVANEYNLAKMVWDNAVEASRSNNHEYAASLYEQAEDLFSSAYLSARRKREAAAAAMAAAVERQALSRALALQADEKLGLVEETQVEETHAMEAEPEQPATVIEAGTDETSTESKGE